MEERLVAHHNGQVLRSAEIGMNESDPSTINPPKSSAHNFAAHQQPKKPKNKYVQLRDIIHESNQQHISTLQESSKHKAAR